MGGGSTSGLHNGSTIPGPKRGYEVDLHKNLDLLPGSFLLFKVPQTGIDTIRSKLTMNLHDEYANVLKGMYSVIFNGGASSQNTSIQV